jgi:hypothetical protein
MDEAAEKPEQVFDGNNSQGEIRDDGTVVIGEQRDVLYRTSSYPRSRHCYSDPTDAGEGRRVGGMNRTCEVTEAHTDRRYGDVRTVRIVDRERYVQTHEQKGNLIGAGIGAGIGALGFLALFAGPIGWLVGALGLVGGAIIGSVVGAHVAKKNAEKQPEVFDEVVRDTRTVTSHP